MLENHKFRIVDTMPIDFSAINELAFTNDGKIFFYNFMKENLSKMNASIECHKNGAMESTAEYHPETNLDDISELIVRRIKSGYGLDINKNMHISENFSNKGINVVWRWLNFVNNSSKSQKSKRVMLADTDSSYKGIANILGIEPDLEEIKEGLEFKEK